MHGEEAPTEPTMLEIYNKLEHHYSELRGIDVELSLRHDDWKRKIDQKTKDRHNLANYEQTCKIEQNRQMKERIDSAFKKHMDQTWKDFMT
jgi:hypothetical protein